MRPPGGVRLSLLAAVELPPSEYGFSYGLIFAAGLVYFDRAQNVRWDQPGDLYTTGWHLTGFTHRACFGRLHTKYVLPLLRLLVSGSAGGMDATHNDIL